MKDIPGYEGQYAVTTDGRVWSYRKYHGGKGTFLKQDIINSGYYRSAGRYLPESKLVHRLVAVTYIPNPQNKPTVNHKNGIRTDNRLENLEWATYPENHRHSWDILGRTISDGLRESARKNGLKNKGRKHSEESNKKKSESLKGHKQTEYWRQRMKEVNCKTVYQYTKSNILCNEFPSVKEAVRSTGIKNISSCACGKLKSAGGFFWSYEKKSLQG